MAVIQVALSIASLLLIVTGLVLFVLGAALDARSPVAQGSADNVVQALKYLLGKAWAAATSRTSSPGEKLMARGLIVVIVGVLLGIVLLATAVAGEAAGNVEPSPTSTVTSTSP